MTKTIVQVDHTERFYVWELIANGGSCFVICLEEFEDGGAGKEKWMRGSLSPVDRQTY